MVPDIVRSSYLVTYCLKSPTGAGEHLGSLQFEEKVSSALPPKSDGLQTLKVY